MAETDDHRDLMIDTIESLKIYYADEEKVYVSGNLLVFYKRGDRHRHVSPDVFVVRGVTKHKRRNYLIWEEGKRPELAIEITSQSTREEDVDDKFALYQDELKVYEYFLFDPFYEYLNPPLLGYRLQEGRYTRIKPIKGRLTSKVLGLHLERNGVELRFYNPATGKWLATRMEIAAQAEVERDQAEAARDQAKVERDQARAARDQAKEALEEAEAARRHDVIAWSQIEAKNERLLREIEALRRRLPDDE